MPVTGTAKGKHRPAGAWRQRKRRLAPAGLELALRKCRLRRRWADFWEVVKHPHFYSDCDKGETYLRKKFIEMIKKTTFKRLLLVGYGPGGLEMMRLKQRSRWNLDGYPWRKYWKGRIRQQFLRLNRATMITLTYDRDRFLELCPPPPDWPLSTAAWAVLMSRYHLIEFRRRLWDWCERNGRSWLWLGSVLELQEDGWPHFHILWIGHGAPPPPLMVELWGWCQAQALDVTRSEGTAPDLYLSKYLTKFEEEIRASFEGQGELWKSDKLDSLIVLWWFRIRQFAFRPKRCVPAWVRLEIEREIIDPAPTVWAYLGWWDERSGEVEILPSAEDREPELAQALRAWGGCGPPPFQDVTPKWMDFPWLRKWGLTQRRNPVTLCVAI